jgi:hypothetical protein
MVDAPDLQNQLTKDRELTARSTRSMSANLSLLPKDDGAYGVLEGLKV